MHLNSYDAPIQNKIYKLNWNCFPKSFSYTRHKTHLVYPSLYVGGVEPPVDTRTCHGDEMIQ